MESFIKLVDKLNNKIGIAVSWLTVVLVLITCYDVAVRYIFEESSAAFQEIEWHLFAIIFLAAAAYTLKSDDHVRVDLFYSRFPIKRKALIDFIGSILFLIPFCMLVIW
ncbi:MAG: TRAP transporter small permease subunit, partial [Ignavibacteriales bacterium]